MPKLKILTALLFRALKHRRTCKTKTSAPCFYPSQRRGSKSRRQLWKKAQESFRVAQFQLDNLNDQQTDYIANLQTIANANGGVANSNQSIHADSVEKVTEALRKQMALRTVDPSAITGVTPDLGQLLPTVQTADILERDRAVTDAMIREPVSRRSVVLQTL